MALDESGEPIFHLDYKREENSDTKEKVENLLKNSKLISEDGFFIDIKNKINFEEDILPFLGDPIFFPKYEDVFNDEYDKLIINYRKGIIDKKIFDEKMVKFNNIKMKVIKCRNINDFKKVVDTLPIPAERKKYYIIHELEHGRKAEEYNLEYSYNLNFTQVPNGEDGSFRITPSTAVEYPLNISFEEYSKMFKLITSEVDELSNGDKNQLQLL